MLSDGEIVRLGNPAGEAVGLDLVGAIVGSEGTFAIVTEIVVRLLPKPQAVKTLLAAFHSVEACSQTVSDVIAAGIMPAALEFMDDKAIEAVEASVYKAGYPRDARAALLIEVDGFGRAWKRHPTRSSRSAARTRPTKCASQRTIRSALNCGSAARAHSARWAASALIWSSWMQSFRERIARRAVGDLSHCGSIWPCGRERVSRG